MSSLTATQANRILLEAVKTTDLRKFDEAVRLGADLGALNEGNLPPFMSGSNLVGVLALQEAIQATQNKKLTPDHIAIIERLLEMDVDVNERQNALDATSTPMYAALCSGHCDIVDLLLRYGAELSVSEQERRPLFQFLAQQGSARVMTRVLMYLPSDLHRNPILINELEMAFCEAAAHGQAKFVEMLLKRRLYLNQNQEQSRKVKKNAIMQAEANGHSAVAALIRNYDSNYLDGQTQEQTALHSAIQSATIDAAKQLLIKGADPNAFSKLNQTPLMYAASRGHSDMARILVEFGANLRAFTDYGCVLHTAAYGGLNWLVEACLEAGEKVNHQDDWGNTPLMQAAKSGQLHTMQLLVKHGADINHVAHYEGDTPLHTAIYSEHEEVAQWLIEQGADLTAEFENPDAGTVTPLMAAAFNKQTNVVKMLIKAGADVCAIASGENYTALIHAADSDSIEITKLLLQAGADVAPRNDYGWTALIRAALCGHEEVTALLIETGAAPNTQDNHGETALHKAALGGHVAIVSMLIAAGADRSIVNKHGHTALDIAKEADYEKVVELLKN